MNVSARLAGRIAIVTGAGSGIGAATARRLGSEGAFVVIADVARDAARDTALGLAEDGIESTVVELDVASRSQWEAMATEVARECGGIDVLVNNAGITRDRTLLKMTDEEWDAVVAVHLTGTWLGCQAVVPVMKSNGGGAIVNVTSASRHGAFGQANYSAAKAGVVGLTRTVALEHARHGIRCNVVAPGSIDTPMTQAVPDDVRETWLTNIALGRFGQPDEIASVVAFLASEDASFMTGAVIDVTGLEARR